MPNLQTAILDALLEEAAFSGWTETALEKAAESLGKPKEYARIAFPKGIADATDLYMARVNETMIARLAEQNLPAMKIRGRIAAAVWTRIGIYSEHKEAVRALMSYYALPPNAVRAMQRLAKSCSEMWYAAGDTSTDYNWYTKRFLLGGVYTSTLFYWLNDESQDHEKTREFLHRRIEDVMRIQQVKQQVKEQLSGKFRKTGTSS